MSYKTEETRALPNAVGPEKSILSSMMQDSDYLDKAIELGLNKHSFYVPAYGALFEVMQELHDKQIPIELVSFTQALKDRNLLENVGGSTEVAAIYTYSPTAAHFEHHAEIVIEKAQARELISKCTTLISKAYENEDISELLDASEREILSIRQQDDSAMHDWKELVEEVVNELESCIQGDIPITGLETRFQLLNTMTGGVKAPEMWVIAARPSMGKTSLMCNLVTDFMMKSANGLVFTLEMNAKQLARRIVYGKAKFNSTLLRPGFRPTNEEVQNIASTIRELVEKHVIIDDTPAISVDELRAKARRKKREENIKYIAIDYLQLMKGDKSNGREREIADISGGLKALAKELEIPVVVLAQLNRSPEKRSDGEPRMSDLRESGSIEADADLIGLLHRKGYYSGDDSDKDTVSAELIIAKSREGPTGSIPINFTKSSMNFH